MTRKMALLSLIACITPTILHAQQAAPSPAQRPASSTPASAPPEDDSEVVVTGQRLRGAVLGTIPPEETFSAADVRSFGVSSITDLLAEISPQTTSGRGGTPVVLLNGRRISGLGEIRDIPTEAIQRVEVLPEEVALKYGYTAEQKVVNIVLRQRFRANTAEVGLAAPTAGGQMTGQLNGTTLHLRNDSRFNLAVNYSGSDRLMESDRDIVSDSGGYGLTGNVSSATNGAQIDPALSTLAGTPVTIAGVPSQALAGAPSLASFVATANKADGGDLSGYRSLLAATNTLTVNAVVNRMVFQTVSATFNASATASDSKSLLGLARTRLTIPAGDPYSPFADDVVLSRYRPDLGALEQDSRDYSGHLGFTLDNDIHAWRWSLTGNYDHAYNRTLTDRGVDNTALQARLDALDPTFNPFGDLPASPFLTDRATSTTDTGNIQLVVNGAAFKLPAGDLSTTLKVGAEGSRLDAESIRSGVTSPSNLSRGVGNAQVSVDLPITSRRNDYLAGFGDLSANLNLAVNDLSDFGTLTTVGYGVTYSPIKPISFIVSMSRQENAPTTQQLGAAQVSTPDVQVFDYVNGESVNITRTSGGNPDLKAEERKVLKLGVTFQPAQISGLSITANYFRSRTDNPIASFPTASAATEAAFPTRFTRDIDGDLTRIDARPVNFARQESDQIRWGFNYSRQIGKTPPRPDWAGRRSGDGPPQGPGQGRGQGEGQGQGRPAAPSTAAPAPTTATPNGTTPSTTAADPAALALLQGLAGQGGDRAAAASQPPPADDKPANQTTATQGPGGNTQNAFGGDRGPGGPGGPGGRGGFGGPPPGLGAARLQLALFHTVHLREKVTIADGMAPLDLLNGDAISSNGGQARHEVEAQAGFTKMGLGARVSINWQSATDVDQSLAGSSGALHFSDLTTVNLRLFANLAAQRALVMKHPFFRGARVTLAVTNLFDAHMSVHDANGAAPITYQPDYLDPLGRSVKIGFRKVFF